VGVAKSRGSKNDSRVNPGSPEGDATQAAWFSFGRAMLLHAATKDIHDVGADPPSADLTNQATAFDDVAVDDARSGLHAALESASAFAALCANASLSQIDAEVLALLACAETNTACQRLVASLNDDPRSTQCTLGVLQDVFERDDRAPLSVAANAPLIRSGFVTVESHGAWVTHVVKLHPTVVWALLGDGSRDPELPAATESHEISQPSPESVLGSFILVNGPDRMRRRQAGARATGFHRFLCADAPTSEAAWAALVREATMSGQGIIIEVGDELPEPGRVWIERAIHVPWVLSTRSGPPAHELPSRQWVDVIAGNEEPTDDEWAGVLGADTPRSHRLTFDQLHRVGRNHAAARGDLDLAVRRLASGKLEKVTRRISPSRTWDDIVISDDQFALLRSIGERYRNSNLVFDDWGFSPSPSRGLVALFSGPSGTGKTLASEIIAKDLGLDVFKMDLSAVVSKYIGETEKNLEQVFDAASAGNMVLFFDEADSLFGKRSEVKDSRDRYANIGVSYLLQRLETYDGVVIMATNFEKNIDEAFLRRIHVRVAFTLPQVAEREQIWHKNLPETAPRGDLDIGWLAEKFELSGGTIRNAAVQTAFSSASAGTGLSMDAAIGAVAAEFRKMGRLVRQDDFGEFFDLVADE